MYFLEFLEKWKAQSTGVEVEYRLACSGEFYNREVLTAEWRKSDITRLLLNDPVFVAVASRPFDDYPQELSVRFNVAEVTEPAVPAFKEANRPMMSSSRTFLPDRDIVEDLCSILTLLSRRLVTPIAKVREVHPPATSGYLPSGQFPLGSDVSMPVLHQNALIAWRRRPATVITTFKGQNFKSNDPPPIGVAPTDLRDFLMGLPRLKDSQTVLQAARIYRSALELIEDRPDTAYLALVSVVESLASAAFPDFEPTDEVKISRQVPLQQAARGMGLEEGKIRELALMATSDERWLTQKFVKFCTDFCPLADLRSPDRTFITLDHLLPELNDEEFRKSMKRIYSARSKYLHSASPFPPGVGIGTSPWISIRDLPVDLTGKLELPPVTWFERVASIAVHNFLLPKGSSPFLEFQSEATKMRG